MWFEIRVRDAVRAMAFYQDLCGWTFEQLPGYEEPYWLIGGSGSGVQGALMLGAPSSGGTRLYVEVADLQHAADRAVSLGGARIEAPRRISPTAGVFAVVADPEGNQIGLWADL
jgi:hypothetical protein